MKIKSSVPKSIQESDELPDALKDIFSSTYECIARVDSEGCYLSVNEPYAQVCGYSQNEMLGMHWRETVHPEDHSVIDDKLEKVQSLGRAEAEIRGLRKNGFVFYKQLLMVKGLESDTSTVHHYCFINDITEKLLDELTVLKSVKQSLESQEQRFYELIKDIPGIVFQSDINEHWSFQYLSPGIEKLLGIPAYQLLKNGTKNYESFIHEQDLAYVKDVIAEALYARKEYSVEYRIRTKNNEIRWCRERASFSQFDLTDRSWVGGIIRDISNDRQIEKQLDIAQTVINNAEDIIIWLNEAGKIVYANDAASITLGYSHRELLSLSVFDIDPNSSSETRDQFLNTLNSFSSKSLNFESSIRTKDQRELSVEIISSLIDFDDERFTCVIARNIDSRKTLELSSHLFHSLSLKILSSDSQQDVLRELSIQVAEIIPDSVVGVLFPDQTGNCVDHNNSILSNDSRDYSRFDQTSFPLVLDSNIVRSGQVEAIGSGYWQVPVLIPGKHLMGLLTIENKKRKTLRVDEIELLKKVSTLVSLTTDTVDIRQEFLKYEKFFESGNDLMVYLDRNYRVQDVNRGYEIIHARSRKELIGKTYEEIVGENNSNEAIRSGIDRGLSGESVEIRDWVSNRKGVYGFFHIKIRPVDDGQNVLGVLVIMTDITQLFNMSEALRESRNRYRTVADNSTDLILITRFSDGKIISANSAFSKISGYSVEELFGQKASRFYSVPEHRAVLISELEKSGYSKNFKTSMRAKQGRDIPVILNCNLIEHLGEKCIFTITRDLSEEIDTQIALRNKDKAIETLQQITIAANKANERDSDLKSVLEMIVDFCGWRLAHIWFLNYGDKSLYSSQIWRLDPVKSNGSDEFVKITEETLLQSGKDLPGKILKSKRAEWMEDYNRNKNSVRVEKAEKAGIVSAFGFPVLVEDKVVAVVEFFSFEHVERDEILLEDMIPIGIQIGRIIEKTQVNFALEQSRINFTKAINACPDCVAIIRLHDGKILNFNTAVVETTGYSREELNNGNGIMFWVDEDAPKAHVRAIRKRGQLVNHSMLMRCKDGSTFPCLMSSTLIDVDGQKCSFSIVKDISGLTLSHEEVQEKQAQEKASLASTPADLTSTKSTLLRTNRALKVLSTSNSLLSSDMSEVELFQSICEVIVRDGEYQSAWIGSFDRESKSKLRTDAFTTIELSSTYMFPDSSHSRVIQYLCEKVMSSVKPVLVQTTSDSIVHMDWAKEFAEEGVSVIGLPLKSNDSILRVLAIAIIQSDTFDEEEISLLTNVAENLVHTLNSISESTQRKRAEELLAIENRLFQLIANTTELSAMLSGMVKIIETSLKDYTCSILLLNDKETSFYNGASPNMNAEYIEAVLQNEEDNLLKEILSGSNSIIIEDTFADCQWTRQCQQERYYDYRSCCILPIRAADGRLIGALSVYSRHPGEMEPHFLETLDRITFIAGGALDSFITQSALRKNEERLSLALKGSQDGLWDIDLETEEVYWSPGWKLMLGYQDHELMPSLEKFVDLLHPDYKKIHDTFVKEIDDKLELEFKMQHKEGHYIDVLSRASGLRKDVGGEVNRIVGTHIDLTERNRVARKILESESKFRVLYDDSPSMFITLDEKATILTINKYGADHLGIPVENLIGQSILETTHPDDAKVLTQKLQACVNHPSRVQRCELRKIHKYGDIIWIRATMRLTSLDEKEHVILVTCEDISEARILSEQLEYQANHDALTGLINRIEFEKRLRRVLNSADDEADHALCYLDLDQFKIINDTCGHLAGDELLKRVGDVLNTVVRKRDTLARMGGDEFAVLLEHCPLAQAKRVAQELLHSIESLRFTWEGKRFVLGVSIGLVPMRAGSGSLSDILSAADEACYVAKDSGRNRVHVYYSDDAELTRRRSEMEWVAKINQALEEDLFCLHAQSIGKLQRGNSQSRGHHYEILLRMEDEEGNLVYPEDFLPAADRYNLSEKIDQWVVEKTLQWLTNEENELDSLAICSINLSGQSMSERTFLDFILRQFKKYPVPAEKICFEVTETSAIDNFGAAMKFMKALKDIGCLFALDDFGTGVSSFNYLKNLPVDFLKIDGSFIKDIDKDPIDYAMVRSINEIGQVMGKETIAEFVDTDKILEIILEIGINYAQGYTIGKPVAIEKLNI